MTKIDAHWENCDFGIDTDGRLKMQMDVKFKGETIPIPIQIILAFGALAEIAKQNGMCEKELYAMAFRKKD